MPSPVLVRPVTTADLPIFYVQQLDPEATQMAAFAARDWAAFSAHWGRILADATVMVRTIEADGQVAGNIVGFVADGERHVGYWLGREYWGQGIATAALAQFVQWTPERPLMARVARHNVGSRRVLEKCGFVVVGYEWSPTTETLAAVEEVILRLEATT